ncbi:MAG: sulfite exporter TauE/SafE family protein [Thermoleophilia bacterium]|nr:sulfite exporter TauE/SafE family protein [Thermoleophilia bacterium]
MNIFRAVGSMMMMSARAYAAWDVQMCNNIVRSRRRLFVLGLMFLPIIVGGIAYAQEITTALPEILGDKEPYSPAFYSLKIFFISIGVGMAAGLITGCIGAGGGFVIAPALMSAGVRGILAVGTDLFHIFAKAIMGSVLHRKLGNISFVLAIAFLVGSIGGATVGGYLNRSLYDANPVLSDLFITLVYVLMLGFLGTYAMTDFLKSRKSMKEASRTFEDHSDGVRPKDDDMTGLADKLQKIKIPPMIRFDQGVTPGGRRISSVFLVMSGAVVGLAAAIMGVGGGFLTFPIFVYVLGVSSATTVGTDIFQIIFTAGYASLGQYAIYGFVFYTLALGMLLGSLVGVQIGSIVTKVVAGSVIRGFYAITILAGFTNRLFALPDKLVKMEMIGISSEMAKVINTVGVVIFFSVIAMFAIWVFKSFFSNISTLKGEDEDEGGHISGHPAVTEEG